MKNIQNMSAEEFIKKLKKQFEDEICNLIYTVDDIAHDHGSLAFRNGQMFALNENLAWLNSLLQEIKDIKGMGDF